MVACQAGHNARVYPLEIEAWSDFAVGIAGAGAALTGLLFVAVSINLERILSLPHVPRRAAQSLILLATPVFTAIAILTPGQPTWGVGVELILIAAVVGSALVLAGQNRAAEQPFWSWLVNGVLSSVVLSLGTLVAGISLVADLPGLGGLYWIPLGTALAWLGGLFNAWVLLVEIMR
jgi:modulator of FtsH protease